MVAACPFPSLRGSQVLIRELAEALVDRGHEVHLVAYPEGESLVPVHGIFIHRARGRRLATGLAALGWRRVIVDAFVALTLLRVVRQQRIQVIHAHNYEGPLIGYFVRLLTGVPVVYHSHNALSDELGYYFRPGWRRGLARFLGRVLDAQIPRRADFSIALTHELRSFLRTRGVAANKIAVIPPGIRPTGLAEPVKDMGPFSSRFVVMYAGNLDAYQDLDVLYRGFARAAENIDEALLVLVTHETNWRERVGSELQALLDRDLAKIVVTPAFSVVRRFMARADVLVCPRSSWSGFPIKLLNYLASGRAVVAAAGSAKGVVRGQTALVFRNGDANELALALRRLSVDAALKYRLGENARVIASASATWEEGVSRIERIYTRVCRLERGEAPCPRRSKRVAGAERLIASARGRMNGQSTIAKEARR